MRVVFERNSYLLLYFAFNTDFYYYIDMKLMIKLKIVILLYP
jgi:hypothetical protein